MSIDMNRAIYAKASVLFNRSFIDRAARSNLFFREGTALKVYLTLAAIAPRPLSRSRVDALAAELIRVLEPDSISISKEGDEDRRSRVASRWVSVGAMDLMAYLEAAAGDDPEAVRQKLSRSVGALVRAGLVKKHETPGRENTYQLLASRVEPDPWMYVPSSMWRNRWISSLTGVELGVYLLLVSTISKSPRSDRRPRSGTGYVAENELASSLQVSVPTVTEAVDRLRQFGVVSVTYKHRRNYVLLVDPDLTRRAPSSRAAVSS